MTDVVWHIFFALRCQCNVTVNSQYAQQWWRCGADCACIVVTWTEAALV